MPLVDRDGRVLGRWNVVDAAVAIFALALIPLAYGAYLLFRTPPPRLVAIEPNTLVAAPDLRVSIRGENLRPYMRVSFNDIQGNSFVFRSTSEALVDLNPMPPGVYDVVLYDNSQERARLSRAFTLAPPPLPESEVMLIGTFGNLTADRAATLKPGMKITGIGELTEVAAALPETTRVFAGPILEIPIEKAVRAPVMVRAACKVRAPQGVPHCAIGDAALQHTSLIVMTTPIGQLPFQVDQIRGLQPLEPVQVTVQVAGRSEIVEQVRQGDRDFGQFMNPLAAGAVVTEVRNRVAAGEGSERADVSLTAQAQRGSGGWIYASNALRAGATIPLRTPKYELQALVLRVTPDWTPPASTHAPINGGSQ